MSAKVPAMRSTCCESSTTGKHRKGCAQLVWLERAAERIDQDSFQPLSIPLPLFILCSQ